MRIKLFGCVIRISPVFMGMITILLCIDQTQMMGLVLGAMAIHELGHVTMMILVGCPPREIRFLPFEINIVSDQSCSSAWEQFSISVGGIIINSLVFLVFIGEPFGYVNLYLALFNAIPLYSMDGYQILTHLFGEKSPVTVGVCTLFTLGVLCGGGWLLCKEKNPMLFLFALYLLVLGIGEKRKNTSG